MEGNEQDNTFSGIFVVSVYILGKSDRSWPLLTTYDPDPSYTKCTVHVTIKRNHGNQGLQAPDLLAGRRELGIRILELEHLQGGLTTKEE